MSNEAIHLINKAKAEAQREAFFSLITQNKKLLVKIIMIILTVGIIAVGMISYRQSQQKKFSEILHQSLIEQQLGNIDKARDELKKIIESKSAPSGVKSIASLRYSALLIEEGKNSEAAKIYSEVSDCGSCDKYVRDLSRLLMVKLWMSDAAELGKSDLAERIQKLEGKSKILKNQIAEQRGLLALQKNNREEAYKIFEAISKDKDVSQELKARAADEMKMSK